ncbi:hypothetical protein M3Y95_00158600 [Aphelenchoides besseyi]|nr:hypothetical protein M3Y95_00158600 [Aphelenchoides besseyi]
MIVGCLTIGVIFNSTFKCRSDELEVICLNENRNLCVPPLRSFDSKFRSAKTFKIGTCVIEKSMSTIMAAITCLLHDHQAFLSANRTVSNDMYENRFCKDKNEYKSLRQLLQENSLNESNPGWLFLAAIRDPIDRFLSGYVDKCIKEQKRKSSPGRCYGCGTKNLTCFVERLYTRAMRYANGDTRLQSYEDIHLFPQNWHCNFNSFFSKFTFLRFVPPQSPAYGQMLETLADLLAEQEVPAGVTHQVVAQLRESQTAHSTLQSTERWQVGQLLRENKNLMKKLIQLFYYDFVLFGFEFPQI